MYIIETSELFDVNNSIEYFYNKYKINNNGINNETNKDEIINNIRDDIKNGTLNSLISNIIENGKKDIIIKDDDNILYQITSTENQNNNNNDNISTIILGKCEKRLKEQYDIDENKALLIFKIDYFQPGSKIPIIGYEIFHPNTKKKLDLKYCEDIFINYNIPVNINESNLFKYDPNNEYYTDECFPSTSESGTDILINDRHNEFNDNNLSLCEINCTFVGYVEETKKAKCECGVKSKQLVISDLINKTELLSHNFSSKSQSLNMLTMKCYYTLFTKNGLLKNIGSYIILFTILLIIISGLLFHKCGYTLLEDEISNIIASKKEETKKNTIINDKANIKNNKIIKKK